MLFKDLKPGDVFQLAHPYPGIEPATMMKVVGMHTYPNFVYINYWRAGTLGQIFEDEKVTKLHSTYVK